MTTRMGSSGESRRLPDQVTGSVLTGWVIFGGVILTMLGVMNVVHGITALQYEDLLLTEFVYDNLTFWGWLFLGWGALQVVGGIAAFMGTSWGPLLGMGLASFSAVAWFFMIFAAPAAGVVGIALSVAIIASLATAFGD